jgi:hypothetical protein
MNPFNSEPLTAEQLSKDCLCNLSVNQEQVKSSRLMMGYILEQNIIRLAKHFNCPVNTYKIVKINPNLAYEYQKGQPIFFRNGVPDGFVNTTIDLNQFKTFDEAYHRLMIDLTILGIDAINLVIPVQNKVKKLIISGGFAKNELFVRLLATHYYKMEIFTSECENATAIGAALMVYENIWPGLPKEFNLGLKKWETL